MIVCYRARDGSLCCTQHLTPYHVGHFLANNLDLVKCNNSLTANRRGLLEKIASKVQYNKITRESVVQYNCHSNVSPRPGNDAVMMPAVNVMLSA